MRKPTNVPMPGAGPGARQQNHAVEGNFWPPVLTGTALQQLAMQVQFEMSQWWDPERILSHQLAQLRNVMLHALATTPFYKGRLEAALTQHPSQALSLDSFRKIPILTRSEFQDAGDSIHSTAVPAGHGMTQEVRTSGSTGQPLALKGTGLTQLFNSALNLRNHLWHRRDFTKKALAIRGMTPGKAATTRSRTWGPAIPPGENVTTSMTQPTSDLLRIIKTEDPAYLLVHPGVLRDLLYLSREQGYQPANLLEVSSMGEILYPELRDRCRSQWNVRVTESYSCQELGMLAFQCPQHQHLHVQSENALVEVLRPDNTPCEPGEIGKTVISSLHNFATPVLRYENGDLAELGEPCPCGRGLPVLKRIIGRVRNTAVLPGGERVMPNLLNGPLLHELPLKHFQLVQKTVELIEARLVMNRRLTAAEESALAEYFRKGLRHGFKFNFVYLDEITRGANGKYEVFRCEVPEARSEF